MVGGPREEVWPPTEETVLAPWVRVLEGAASSSPEAKASRWQRGAAEDLMTPIAEVEPARIGESLIDLADKPDIELCPARDEVAHSGLSEGLAEVFLSPESSSAWTIPEIAEAEAEPPAAPPLRQQTVAMPMDVDEDSSSKRKSEGAESAPAKASKTDQASSPSSSGSLGVVADLIMIREDWSHIPSEEVVHIREHTEQLLYEFLAKGQQSSDEAKSMGQVWRLASEEASWGDAPVPSKTLVRRNSSAC